MKNLIITADDFGVFPSINQGVKEAVLAGKVNSVAALSNHSDSVTNVKELISEVGNKAEIGCHLTISSGKPLTIQNNNAFMTGNYFKSFGELKVTAIEKQTEELEKELTAQVQLFLDSGIPITNLSCHHSTLSFTQGLFDVYLKIAEKFNLPIRSINVIPEKKDNTYRTVLELMLWDDLPNSKLAEIKRFGKEITHYLKHNRPMIKTPGALESRHYGPMPLVDIWDVSIPRRVKQKHKDIINFIEEFKTSEFMAAELMLHLIKDDIYLYELDEEIDYPGINKKYFDSRKVEFESIKSFDFNQYSSIIKTGSWKELV